MPIPDTTKKMSPQAFLDWEKTAESKHEYVNGEIFAMVGARDAHVTVSLNFASLLRDHVRGGPCRVYMADMKVRVDAANAFFYPDVVATCDDRDRKNDYFKSHPTLIVEVLSESTAGYDRGEKFGFYRKLPSLTEYVIVDPERINVDVFRLGENGHWVLYPFTENQEIELASLNFRAAIESLYEDVTLSTEPVVEPNRRP